MTNQQGLAPYPDNDPRDWVIAMRVLPAQRGNFVTFSYDILADSVATEPFIRVSHEAQIRENHQKIMEPTPGFYRHLSGIDVPNDPGTLYDFLLTDSRAYRWDEKRLQPLVQWEDTQGRTLPPFLFPSYSGVMEGLDPQWEREKYTLSIDIQVAEIIERFKRDVFNNRLRGDFRGTVKNLQVGAGADDGHGKQAGTSSYSNTSTSTRCGYSTAFGAAMMNWYRLTGASGIAGETVSVATYTMHGDFTGQGSPLTNIYMEQADAPAAPTDETDMQGRTLTTNFTAFDTTLTNGVDSTADVQSSVQEIADEQTSTVIQILHRDDGSSTAAANNIIIKQYDEDTAKAVKLDITHVAAGGIIQHAQYHYANQGVL